MTVTPEQLQQIRNYTQTVQLNDFVRVCSLVNLLCDEIEILNGVVDQKTNDFFKGVNRETGHEPPRVPTDSVPTNLQEQDSLAATGDVSTPPQDRGQGVSAGTFPQAESTSTVSTNDLGTHGGSKENVEPRGEAEAVGRQVRQPVPAAAGDSSESSEVGLTRNQRRRLKRQKRKAKK